MHSLVRCERCEAEKVASFLERHQGELLCRACNPASAHRPRSKWGRSFALASLVERSGLEEPAVSALLDFYAEQGLAGPHESGEGVWLCFRPKQVLYYRHRLEILELEAIGP